MDSPVRAIKTVHAPNIPSVSPLAHELGSLPTSEFKRAANATSISFVELCCGSANLCKAFAKKSVSSLGIDHRYNKSKPVTPYVELDLSTVQGQTAVETLLQENLPNVVHAGPPCGTASRARERAISPALLRQGAPYPRPLRSELCPRGLPHITGIDLAKVIAANAIYDFVLKIFLARHAKGEYFSLENPETSLFWFLIEAILLMGMSNVFDVCFSQCIHGGTRPVRRRWVTNMASLVKLAGQCPGVSDLHVHASFKISRAPTGWKFDTAEEATYPDLLCSRYVDLAVPLLPIADTPVVGKGLKRLEEQQLSEEAHTAKKRMLRSSIGMFIRGNKYPQLISEFQEKREVDSEAPIHSMIALGDLHFGKVLRVKQGLSGELAEVGVFRTPAEFIETAKGSRHPIDLESFLPEALCSNIFFLLTTPAHEVARMRLEKLKLLRSWSAELKTANDEIHKGLSSEQAKVSEGKHFSLLKRILEHIGYPDLDIVPDLIQGTTLTGSVPKSHMFPRRHNAAWTSSDEVLHTSKLLRESVLARIGPSPDPEVDLAVYTETCAEAVKGWISEPIQLSSLEEEFEGKFVIAKRFGIRQGEKIRCIDDYSISSANATIESHEKLDLYGCDELFAALKVILSAVQADGTVTIKLASGKVLSGRLPAGSSQESSRDWKGRTYDLKSAYRQIHLAGDATNRRFTVVALWNPVARKTELRKQFATPFGSIASVYLFNRAARALWAVGCFMHVVWVNFFDDFPCIEPVSSCDTAHMTISSMCMLLGWRLALEKSKPFEYRFSMLGIVTDLHDLKRGTAKADNKPERLQELAATIRAILKMGSCPKPLVAELRGRAQYASAQIAGRIAVGTLNGLADHQYRQTSDELTANTIGALRQLLFLVTHAKPRLLHCSAMSQPILVFTDGAAEDESITMGAVVIDTASCFPPYQWGGHIAREFVNSWKKESIGSGSLQRLQTQVIGQAELLPVALVKWSEAARFQNRRVVYYIDNDGSRHSLIRGCSHSKASNQILDFVCRLELDTQSWSWYTRVPSKSNPADDPSRGVLVPSSSNMFAHVIDMPKLDPALVLSSNRFSLLEMD